MSLSLGPKKLLSNWFCTIYASIKLACTSPSVVPIQKFVMNKAWKIWKIRWLSVFDNKDGKIFIKESFQVALLAFVAGDYPVVLWRIIWTQIIALNRETELFISIKSWLFPLTSLCWKYTWCMAWINIKQNFSVPNVIEWDEMWR